jgi:hypothetical protein
VENALSALALSSDPQALFAAKKILLTYGIKTTFCRTSADTIAALKQKRFDLFVLDFDLRGAGELLQSAFAGGYGHARNVVVFASDSILLANALQRQVKHVLHKPIVEDLFSKTLKTVYSHIILEKRAYFRCPVRIGASAAYQEKWLKQPLADRAVLQDISQTGLRLRTNVCLPKDATAFVDFQLPGTADRIHVVGKVMWNDRKGTAGIQYRYVRPEDLWKLRDWLNARCPWTSALVPKPLATPEAPLPRTLH